MGWYNPSSFDIKTYEFYEKVDNGDINWIIPNRMLAFSTPIESTKGDDAAFTPDFYAPILKKLGVTMIVRLTAKDYDREVLYIVTRDRNSSNTDSSISTYISPTVSLLLKY